MDSKGLNRFEAIDVWERVSGVKAVRYRCFKNLSTGKYCVQSADFYQWPLDSQQISALETQYLTLFAEQPPDLRSGAYQSLLEAIEAHEREFS